MIKSPFLMVKSPFLMVKSPFFLVKSATLDEGRAQQTRLWSQLLQQGWRLEEVGKRRDAPEGLESDPLVMVNWLIV
jgi:hypothetical protein